MILCSIQNKSSVFAFPQPRGCSLILIACSKLWGIIHPRIAMKRLYKKNSVALASLSDFVKVSRDTSFI